jgi:L-rhamnose mutarotase
MHRIAFKMKLFRGFENEYKKRHDEIWPQLTALLHEHGVQQYSIFLDEESNDLFGCLITDNLQDFSSLPQSPVMQKWWQYMRDIMETNPDGSPVSIALKEVFYLP